MRNLKIMGLAAVAVLSMSAMMASAASAASYKSEAGGTTYATGVQEGVHTFQAGAKVVCSEASGHTKYVSGTTTLTLTNVQYNKCTVAGQAATVNMNGCDYLLHEPTTAGPWDITSVTIACTPSTNQIIITATTSGCTIKVGEQTPTSATTIENNAGAPKTVTLKASISKIKYTGSGGICGGNGEAGTYTGNLKASGFTDEAHTKTTGIFVG